MIIHNSVLSLCLGAVLSFCTESSDANEKDAVFASLQDAVGMIKARYVTRPASEKKTVENIRININRLDDGLSSDLLSDIYLLSLKYDASLLYDAVKAESFSDSLMMIRAVEKDTDIKNQSLALDQGFLNAGWDGLLSIKVETKNTAGPVFNMLVQVNMAGQPNRTPAFLTLPGLTSPVSGKLPPGEYIFIVSGANSNVVKRQSVSVKGAQKDEVIIQLALP